MNGMQYCEWDSHDKAIELRRFFFQGMFRNSDNTHLVCSSKVNLPEPGDNMYDYNGRFFRIVEIIEVRDHKGVFNHEKNRPKISKVKAIPVKYAGQQLTIKKN
jgi:hypothetical protein